MLQRICVFSSSVAFHKNIYVPSLVFWKGLFLPFVFIGNGIFLSILIDKYLDWKKWAQHPTPHQWPKRVNPSPLHSRVFLSWWEGYGASPSGGWLFFTSDLFSFISTYNSFINASMVNLIKRRYKLVISWPISNLFISFWFQSLAFKKNF